MKRKLSVALKTNNKKQKLSQTKAPKVKAKPAKRKNQQTSIKRKEHKNRKMGSQNKNVKKKGMNKPISAQKPKTSKNKTNSRVSTTKGRKRKTKTPKQKTKIVRKNKSKKPEARQSFRKNKTPKVDCSKYGMVKKNKKVKKVANKRVTKAKKNVKRIKTMKMVDDVPLEIRTSNINLSNVCLNKAISEIKIEKIDGHNILNEPISMNDEVIEDTAIQIVQEAAILAKQEMLQNNESTRNDTNCLHSRSEVRQSIADRFPAYYTHRVISGKRASYRSCVWRTRSASQKSSPMPRMKKLNILCSKCKCSYFGNSDSSDDLPYIRRRRGRIFTEPVPICPLPGQENSHNLPDIMGSNCLAPIFSSHF